MRLAKDREVIKITLEDVESLQHRVTESALSESDKRIVTHILTTYFWVQTESQRAKMTILRLNKIFGLPTEKKPNLNKGIIENNTCEDPNTPIDPITTEVVAIDPNVIPLLPKKRHRKIDPAKNHGRIGAGEYEGCPLIDIFHSSLAPGDCCPDCAAYGTTVKLYLIKVPKVIVLLQGAPLLSGTRYVLHGSYCSVCDKKYIGQLPKELEGRTKYNETCRTSIAIARYYSGMPFYRIEQLQLAQKVPLPDATQWDLVDKLYPDVLPVYLALEQLAANGDLVKYDDTSNRILEAPRPGRSVHTTAFLSKTDGHTIHLFFTSLEHAGENMEMLMDNRTTDKPLITMTDAGAENIPKHIDPGLAARWILCFCLIHGRRNFHELLHLFPIECQFVLEEISKIYQHERHCKNEKYSPERRLEYHQKHSAPVMASLKIWLNNQMLHHVVEKNSGLGSAINYMLRHWDPLTKFLHVVGAPIDNSLCEQMIKVAIRHRRNSLFYRTFRSAQVGDCLMGVIHTAARNNADIFEYLNSLQLYAQHVKDNPYDWLPWTYKITLERIKLGSDLIGRVA